MLRALNELPQKSKLAEPGADWACGGFFVYQSCRLMLLVRWLRDLLDIALWVHSIAR